jgi:hypothetical protein
MNEEEIDSVRNKIKVVEAEIEEVKAVLKTSDNNDNSEIGTKVESIGGEMGYLNEVFNKTARDKKFTFSQESHPVNSR